MIVEQTHASEPDARSGAPGRRGARDRGAALVVAVAFTVMIGTIAAGITAAITSGLGQRVVLEDLRDREYAADAAIERTIAEARSLVVADLECGAVEGSVEGVDDIRIHVDRTIVCGSLLGADGFVRSNFALSLVACEDTATSCQPDDVIVRALVGLEPASDGSIASAPVYAWSVR